jgi:15-cis-phytoene synthase
VTPDEYCQNKAAKSGSSFYYSFLFLPPERRRAITALYAFCREVDDVVDECQDIGIARTKLQWWRSEIAKLYDARPEHPVTQALAPHVQAYGVERRYLSEIIDGMQMDLEQSRYFDFEGLALYCYRVAGVVGLLASGIFGYSQPATRAYASKLGEALQLTNIIRDVGEDARMGRIYLPEEDLTRFKVSSHDILANRHNDAFVELMQFQCQRARATYHEAYRLLPTADYRSQRPGLIMAALYSALLDEIERERFKVLTQRTSLTPVRKLWIAWRSWNRGGPPQLGKL